MLEKLSSYAPAALLMGALAGCEYETREAVKIRAAACLNAFQEGDGDREEVFTATPDRGLDPQLSQIDGEVSGYLQAWYLDSTSGVDHTVSVRNELDYGLTGVAYEGTDPWAVDPTAVWDVALSADNPNESDWEDLNQGLYSSVDFTNGQNTPWDWTAPRLVTVSLFTDGCHSITEDLNGEYNSSAVWVSPESVRYAN